ncbi:hypothetical protein BDW22DRAFT_180176 [Trametopsis cervina]|nr:hypothetical protein BDW22DRAFT_180176 [Trametopsis cervina]
MLPDFTLLDFNPLDIARDLQFAGKAPNRQPKQNEKQTMNSLRQFPTKKPSRLHPDEEADDVELPSGRIVRQPTIIRRGALFYEDIITTLPYREYKHIGDWRGSEPLFISGGEVWVACTVTVEMNENVTNYWILNVKGGS